MVLVKGTPILMSNGMQRNPTSSSRKILTHILLVVLGPTGTANIRIRLRTLPTLNAITTHASNQRT